MKRMKHSIDITKREFLLFFIVFVLILILSLNRHSKDQIFTYHSELFADKAGYNIYLPSLFIYNFNSQELPDSIVSKTGFGFSIDSSKHKIITIYPYGVALLQSPFWLIAHWIDKEKTGFSSTYNKSVTIAAAFYFVLGLFFLYKALSKSVPNSNLRILLTLIISILSTSLLYYGVWESGMSHIYTFAFFSILVYCLIHHQYNWLFYLSCLMIILIRPINICFLLPIILLFNVSSIQEIHQRFKQIIEQKNYLAFILISIVLILPQVAYNVYAFGSPFADSYKNYSFQYLNNPKIAEVLFAPNNGLFLYSPLLLILIFWSIFYYKKTPFKLILPLLLLTIYTFLYATWFSYYLGCGFGHRAFVDILPIFIFLLFQWIISIKNKLIYIVFFITCLYTLKLTFSFDKCFYGSHDWDWQAFQQLLLKTQL